MGKYGLLSRQVCPRLRLFRRWARSDRMRRGRRSFELRLWSKFRSLRNFNRWKNLRWNPNFLLNKFSTENLNASKSTKRKMTPKYNPKIIPKHQAQISMSAESKNWTRSKLATSSSTPMMRNKKSMKFFDKAKPSPAATRSWSRSTRTSWTRTAKASPASESPKKTKTHPTTSSYSRNLSWKTEYRSSTRAGRRWKRPVAETARWMT